MNDTGKVYLVGAGPGDPGLITYKGRKLLEICDAVIYDRLAADSLLDYVKEDCEKIYVGKTAGKPSIRQEEINRIITEKARSYPVVVRLKGGDPYVFGRGGEEALSLREQGIPFEIIPGVTSAVAAAAYAGIPVTHRGVSRSFHVVTGHTADEGTGVPVEFQSYAKLEDTLVILMGLGNLELIREELLLGGKSPDTPVAVISEGTTPAQKEVRGTLQDICRKVKDAGLKSPAVIIIGAVAALDLRTTDKKELTGIRIGIIGTKKITDKLSGQLESLGAQVEAVDTFEIAEYKNNTAFETALHSLEQYCWIVFTSTSAVTIFFNKLLDLQIDYRKLARIKFAVIGSGTKQELQRQGFLADYIPEEYHSKALAYGLCNLVGNKERVLIPRAEQGSEELGEILREHKKALDEVKIYDIKEINRLYYDLKDIEERFDYLTFASASGVKTFFGGLRNRQNQLSKTKIVCIGETTRAALLEYGYDNILIAGEADMKGLTDRITEDASDNERTVNLNEISN